MESPATYIAMDRRRAIAQRVSLPNHTRGAALFADISGFTPLTEALLKEYGQRRGPEELTRQLNLIYDALVMQVHRYGGSVIAFSGDAITCWFDADDGLRAVASGLAMQQAMGQFAALKTPSGKKITLAMKAAVAAGPVRRFLVGDPQIHYIDTLAGATLDRMAAAEHQANKGEVVVDSTVVDQIGAQLEISAWREDHGQRFGVVAQILEPHRDQLEQSAQPILPPDTLRWEEVRPWLLPPVYERLLAGAGEFLTELRPAVAVFLSFSGIDYDADESAGDKLDAYIRWVQNILTRYEGYLFQLTIGDKGSYLYTAFGAPVAHEDDATRAVSAALELQTLPADLSFIIDVKIGISQGVMRTGAYGGTRRRTYGVMGDEVNLAARLMQAAPAGQIFVSDRVRHAVGEGFLWDSLPPFKVKGKSAPIAAFKVTGASADRAIRLQEPKYTLPMVGREAELRLIQQKIAQALAGRGQIVAITAEAGMGKSRLVAEALGSGDAQKLTGYGGECESYGTNISYLLWQPIWRAFFGIDPAQDLAAQTASLERQLAQIDPALPLRLPLLGAVLNLPLPDNDRTRSFDAKLRKTSLESLLVDCVRARAATSPLLFVLEDLHWLDPLSHDLLEVIARAINDLPVLIMLTYRPVSVERLQSPRVEQLPHFSRVELADFTPDEAKRLIGLKLAQFFGDQAEVPAEFSERITARAQGNPFYIEELLNYLQDQRFDPHDNKMLDRLDLPASLHTLILARIDRLTEQQKSTLKVASVVGRLFQAGWLWGMYPDLGRPEQVRSNLETLHRLEMTPLDKPDPELTYLFKHIVTQEVAYESLPYAMRSILHDQFGRFIEQTYLDDLEQYIDLLAFHYDRSENEPKRREYLRKAGELAQAEFANETALDYYRRLLPLLSAADRVPVLVRAGEVLSLSGQYDEALTYYAAARFLLDNNPAIANHQQQLAEVYRKTAEVHDRRSEYDTALELLGRSFEYLAGLEPGIEVVHGHNLAALVLRHQGNNEAAIEQCQHSLAVAEHILTREGQRATAHTYYTLGALYWRLGNLDVALDYCRQSVTLYQQIDDIVGLSDAYNNLSIVYSDKGDWDKAGEALSQSLALKHQIGDIFGQGMMANNLAYNHLDRGEWPEAATLFEESYAVWRQVGSAWGEAVILSNLAQVRIYQEQWAEAETCLTRSGAIFVEIGSEEFLPELERRWGEYYLKTGQPEQALTHVQRSLQLAETQEARLEEGMSYRVLGQVHLARGDYNEAGAALRQSHQILTELNSEFEAAKTVIPLARLALANGSALAERGRLEQAITLFEALGAKAELANARALLTQMG